MTIGFNQQRLDKLDIISENVRDAIEVAREGDNERDTQIRLFLARRRKRKKRMKDSAITMRILIITRRLF